MRKSEKKLTLKEWLEENYKDFPPSKSEMARIEITETGKARKVKGGGIEAIKTRLSNIMIYSRRELAKLNFLFAEDIDNPNRKSREEIGYLYAVR